MKPAAIAGPPVYQLIHDTRDGWQYLDIAGRAPLDPEQFEMARASDKTVLQKLYPGAKDLTGLKPNGKE